MRTKTAYKHETPAPNIPKVEIDGHEPAATAGISIEPHEDEPDNDDVAEAIEKASEADQSALALKKQIEALRASEELQRWHAAHRTAGAAVPFTREGKLAMWKQQGLSDAEAHFLSENPALIDHPEITAAAAHEAAETHGHSRGTEAHMQATKEIFHRHLAQMQEQAAQGQAQAAAAQPTPEFFQPASPPASAPQSKASIYSAPVSRETPDGSYREPRPSSVRLTPDEIEIARATGLSPVEYAANKLRLAREKASGHRQ